MLLSVLGHMHICRVYRKSSPEVIAHSMQQVGKDTHMYPSPVLPHSALAFPMESKPGLGPNLGLQWGKGAAQYKILPPLRLGELFSASQRSSQDTHTQIHT